MMKIKECQKSNTEMLLYLKIKPTLQSLVFFVLKVVL